MKIVTDHHRVNDILLGPLERPALNWLAVHSPKWMNPDLCTVIGVLGTILIFLGYCLSRAHPVFFWLASFGFLVNWYGDSMDGTLARYRKIERPVYGFFIDHITDAASQVLIFIGLGLSPYIGFNIAVLTLAAYFLLSIMAYVRTITAGEFKISYGKLGPTEVRLIAVLLNTAMFIFGDRFWRVNISGIGLLTISPYDLVVGFICFLLLFYFFTTAVSEAVHLSKENH